MFNDANIIKLAQIAEISAGYPLRTSAESLNAGDVRFVQLRDVSQSAGVDWLAVKQVELPSKKEPRWLRSTDIIFSARGTRNLAYALEGLAERAVCAPQFFVISPTNPAIDPAFLAWQINQKPAQGYIAQNAVGAGMPNVRRKALEALSVVLPSIETQRRIAKIHRAAQAECAVLTRLMENRDKQMEALAWSLIKNTKGAPA